MLGEARGDLVRVTPQSQEGLCTEIKQNKQRCSRTVMLKVCPCSRSKESSGRSVQPTETPLPQSSARIPEQAVEDDPRKQLELSVPQYNTGEWKHEFEMSTFTTTILNFLHAEARSDGSSADKLSIDLKFNPWDTAFTFRPEWCSMSKTVFTQYDPFEPWYTCQSRGHSTSANSTLANHNTTTTQPHTTPHHHTTPHTTTTNMRFPQVGFLLLNCQEKLSRRHERWDVSVVQIVQVLFLVVAQRQSSWSKLFV